MLLSRIKTLVSKWIFFSTRDERSIFRETNNGGRKTDEEMGVDGMLFGILELKLVR